MTGVVLLQGRREFLSDKLFNSILWNLSQKLYTQLYTVAYSLLRTNAKSIQGVSAFTTRRPHTIRTRNSFIRHNVNKAMM